MTGNAAETFKRRLHQLATDDGLKARLIRSGFGSAGVQIANRFLALALAIVLARSLGAEGYGTYAYAFAIMVLLMVVAEAGVPTLLMREVAASQGANEWALMRGALHRGMQLVTIVATGVSALSLLVLWWCADALSPTLYYTTGLMLLVLPIVTLCKTVAHALRGLNLVVMGQAIDMLIRPLLVLTMVCLGSLLWPEFREPQYAMAAQLVGAVIVLVIGALTLLRLLPKAARISKPTFKSFDWLRSAIPFTLIGGAVVINHKTDILMLGWLQTKHEVGIYAVAAQGGVLTAFALRAVSSVLAPQFSRLYTAKRNADLARLFAQARLYVFLITLPFAAILVFFGSNIVEFLFGEEYLSSHIPLAILAVGYLGNVSFGPVGSLCQMTGHERETARLLLYVALLNIALNLALIPYYGVSGAALATSVSIITYHWRLSVLCHKKGLIAPASNYA